MFCVATDKKPKEEAAGPKDGEGSPKGKEKEGEAKPRALHKTCSLFVRNIAPSIPQAEIVAVSAALGEERAGQAGRATGLGLQQAHLFCSPQFFKRYPGFMRVALSDPQPERR